MENKSKSILKICTSGLLQNAKGRISGMCQIIKSLLSRFYAMWVLFKGIIIEYNYCKIPRNSPLNENEKGKYLDINWKEKSKFHCKVPKLYGIRKRPGRPPNITNTAQRRLFWEASKSQISSRDLQKSQFTHHSEKSSLTSPWFAKSCILKQEDSPCINC